ncbi:ATP-binding protein [bacterium]|nr:ATP-binding protein [bacterium]
MKKWTSDLSLSKFKRIFNSTYDRAGLSEADTRSKLIDYILFECMGWEESDVVREERCVEAGTFLDYKLSTTLPQIIIEAKKSSVVFELPTSSSHREYKVGGVLSQCKVLIAAMIQARDYAISKGITFCVVTNGDEFVFFRAQNQQGIEWVDHKAILFRGLRDIEANFDLFCSLMARISVEEGKLHTTLKISDNPESELLRFKALDTRHLSRPQSKERNPLFPIIGDIVHRVFQDLASEEAESEILENCYVDSPKKSEKNSPYLDRSAKSISVSKKDAGDFQKRIISSLSTSKANHAEVILLIGSVGVGKSTFIQRFRKVLASKDIDENGIWIYLNFKHHSDTGESLDSFIYSQIEEILNTEYFNLKLTDWAFIKQAYHSEYENLKRGTLAPLFNKDESEFELKFAERVDEWSRNEKENHIIKLLKTASKRMSKSIFLIFDNADQLTPETQNNIFLAAQKLSEKIGCYAMIAMREESYWKNRDSGPLNAFHTTAYNVQPASLNQVISKRFNYAKSLILSMEEAGDLFFDVSKVELIAVIDRLIQTLLSDDNRYIEFIEAISARDTRRALDTTAAFLVSGHTNIEAILRDIRKGNPGDFPIPYHEFLNAIILRDHESYSEADGDILNIFNVSGETDASNFNRVAVLGRILSAVNTKSSVGSGYVLIDEVVNDCHAVGVMPETSLSILNILNRRRLVETEMTIKSDLTGSKYVRATSAGKFYINNLSADPAYLELIINETPVCSRKYFKRLERINGEINAFTSSKGTERLKRVKKRMELIGVFVDYLDAEFGKCVFSQHPEKFSREAVNLFPYIKTKFIKDRQEIISRAEIIFGAKKS